MKKWRKGLILLFVLLLMSIMSACSPVSISGDLSINSDGTGTRTIVGKIDKVGTDDNGCTYYYFKLHGDDLKAWLENKYAEMVPGSEEWLNITVTDSGANEIVTLSFDFTSFDEYAARLQALGFDPEFAGNYVEPVITMEGDAIAAYSESTGVMTAIMKSIQMAFLADDTVYDDACTMDGKSLNGGSSDGVTKDNGIELLSAGSGPALTIQVDGGESKGLFAEAESEEEGAPQFYNYTVPEETEEPAEPDDGQTTGEPDNTNEEQSQAETDDSNAENSSDNQNTEQKESGLSPAVIAVIVVVVVAAVVVIVIVVSRKKKNAK